MPRDHKMHLDDMLAAAEKIIEYVGEMSFDRFVSDAKTFDAVIRNLEIIGEAAKRVPEEVRRDSSDIEWKKIAGLRDMLIHEYLGVDSEIIWDIVSNKIPDLIGELHKLLEKAK